MAAFNKGKHSELLTDSVKAHNGYLAFNQRRSSNILPFAKATGRTNLRGDGRSELGFASDSVKLSDVKSLS